MEVILNDIRNNLNNGAYKNEEQVRFSIVTRILTHLGWDIWNPSEIYYEYPVKKFPQDKNKHENGRVDIALFLSNRSDRTPEVFIETKAIGKLTGNFGVYEEQLQKYNYFDKSAISVLTDGVVWKFYLPSAYGTFSQRLFNEINLKDDDMTFISSVLTQILLKDNFRKTAVQAGLDMLEELKIISEIAPVKNEAEQMAIKLKRFTKYELASQLLEDKYSPETIKKYWDGKNKNSKNYDCTDNYLRELKPVFDRSINIETFNPTGIKPKSIILFNEQKKLTSWRKVYIAFCEKIVEKYPNTKLTGLLSDAPHCSNKNDDYKLRNQKYINVCLSSKRIFELMIRICKHLKLSINDIIQIEV